MRYFFVAALFVSLFAWASNLRVGLVKGANIQTFIGQPGGKYAVQCLSVDGGTDQSVYFRPGCPTRADGGITCVVDAGQGDEVLNFNPATGGSSDAVKVDLAPTEDRFHLATVGNYGTAVYCPVFRRNP